MELLNKLKTWLKASGRLETIVFWQLVVVVIFIPLYLKFPLLRVRGSFISIRLDDVVIFTTLLMWGMWILVTKKLTSVLTNPIFRAIIVFWIVGLISAISAIILTHTATPSLAILHRARRIELTALFMVAYSVVTDKRRFYIVLGSLMLTVFLVLIYGFGQKYLHFPIVSTTNPDLSSGMVYYFSSANRISSTFAGHYDLAIYLVMVISVAMSMLFYFINPKNQSLSKIIRLQFSGLLVVTIGGSLVLLVMTAARLSFVAVIVGIFVAIFLSGKRKLFIPAILGVALILIYPSQLRDRLISTFTVNVQKTFTTYFAQTDSQKVRSSLNISTLPFSKNEETQNSTEIPDIVPGEPTNSTDLGVYRSFQIRMQVEWPRAIMAFIKNPILGTGYSSIGLATDNEILRTLGEIGLFGLSAFILILWIVIKRLVRFYKMSTGFFRSLYAGALAMVAAFIVNSLFIDSFEASKIASLFWLFLGLLASGRNLASKSSF